jgi:uncharacterized protein
MLSLCDAHGYDGAMNPLLNARWRNEPAHHEVTDDTVRIVTEPHTDLWQRTYYGFRSDNAPALLLEHADNFTFTTRVQFAYRTQYDQCGLVIYLDSTTWCKASVEYEDSNRSRLGSVVTNRGYSDWATTDVPTPSGVWYRLSRRGPDFLLESSMDGDTYSQMRVFHLESLGETEPEMGTLDPPPPAERAVPFGVYACSPLDGSFEAVFDQLRLTTCRWMSHGST